MKNADNIDNLPSSPILRSVKGTLLRLPRITRNKPNESSVFLVSGSDIRRAKLPKNLSSISQLRDLFVENFWSRGSAEDREEIQKAKIYLLDIASNKSREIKDLGDVHTGCVLKVGNRNTTASKPRISCESRTKADRYHYFSDSEIDDRSLLARMNNRTASKLASKSKSASQNGSPEHRSRCNNDYERNESSGQKLVCTCPPEVHALLEQRISCGYEGAQSTLPNYTNDSIGVRYDDDGSRQRILQMEAQLANLTAWVQQNMPDSAHLPLPHEGTGHAPSDSSLDSAYSARSVCSHTSTASASNTPRAMSTEIQFSLQLIQRRVYELRQEVRNVRQMQLINQDTVNTDIKQLVTVVKTTLQNWNKNAPYNQEKVHTIAFLHAYKEDAIQLTGTLRDLEIAVEQLRVDVINRGCVVNLKEVQILLAQISGVANSLEHLKANIPDLKSRMSTISRRDRQAVSQHDEYFQKETLKLTEDIKKCAQISKLLIGLQKYRKTQFRSDGIEDGDLHQDVIKIKDELTNLPPTASGQLDQKCSSAASTSSGIVECTAVITSAAAASDHRATSSSASVASSSSSTTSSSSTILKRSAGDATSNNHHHHQKSSSQYNNSSGGTMSRQSGNTAAGGTIPRPQVAFSDTVKVDDGSEVIRLNCSADQTTVGCGVGQPLGGLLKRTPPQPPPRMSSRNGSGGQSIMPTSTSALQLLQPSLQTNAAAGPAPPDYENYCTLTDELKRVFASRRGVSDATTATAQRPHSCVMPPQQPHGSRQSSHSSLHSNSGSSSSNASSNRSQIIAACGGGVAATAGAGGGDIWQPQLHEQDATAVAAVPPRKSAAAAAAASSGGAKSGSGRQLSPDTVHPRCIARPEKAGNKNSC